MEVKGSHWDGAAHPTLSQASGGIAMSDQELFAQRGAGMVGTEWPADVSPTLNAHFGDKQGLEDQHGANGHGFADEVAHGLDATGAGQAVAFDARQADVLQYGEKSGPIDTDGFSIGVMHQMAVRRLLPVECERLQGFEDGWTDIPWRGKPNSPDGNRYKSIGNSMAVNVMDWIGRRLDEVDRLLRSDQTLSAPNELGETLSSQGIYGQSCEGEDR